MAKNCEYIKSDNSRCGAYALKGGRLCWYHEPKNAENRKAASARGARSKANLSREVIIAELIDEVNQVRIPLDEYPPVDKDHKYNDLVGIDEFVPVENGIDIFNLEDLRKWILREMVYTEDNKKYSKLSLADRAIQLKYAEFLFKVLVLSHLEPAMLEIESRLDERDKQLLGKGR